MEGNTTLPIRIMIQKQVAMDLNGERVYRDFGNPESIAIEDSNKVYGLDVSPRPIFDRLIVSGKDGVGGDTVHTLLKIL